MTGGQQGMNFTYTYAVEEMGVLVPQTCTVLLSDSFISKKLLGKKVGCPFCKDGSLVTERQEPIYSGGPRPSSVMHHVGNRYEYACSNSYCNGRFTGTTRWMWID